MGNSTRSINTNGIDGGITSMQSTLNTLASKMSTGNIIYASDVSALYNLFSTFENHQHIVDDLYGIYNFGDGTGNPGYSSDGSYYYPATSTAISNYSLSGFNSSAVQTGQTILATTAANLAEDYSNGLSHYHQWTDTDS